MHYILYIKSIFRWYAWPFGPAFCKIIPAVTDAFYGVSLGCMTTISLHRHRMIVHGMKPQMTFKQAKMILCFIWFISIATISGPLYPIFVYTSNENATKCTPDFISAGKYYAEAYQLTLAIAWYILPLFIIMLTFLLIRYHLKKQMSYEWMGKGEANTTMAKQVLGIKKALRMLAPVVVIFALLMLPWNIFRIHSLFSSFYKIPPTYLMLYRIFAGTLLVANSVVNPFIYYIMSQEFRTEFRKQFWILKRFIGLGKHESEFCVEIDRETGRKTVRRKESMARLSRNSSTKSSYRRMSRRSKSSNQDRASERPPRVRRVGTTETTTEITEQEATKLVNGITNNGVIESPKFFPRKRSLLDRSVYHVSENGALIQTESATVEKQSKDWSLDHFRPSSVYRVLFDRNERETNL